MTFQTANPSMETHPITRAGQTASDLLEDSGNCRQIINPELLSDSLFSEQQKLRRVLDWAHTFLSSGSEVHHEFCRADSLILANNEQTETQKNSPAYKQSSVAKYQHPVSCTAGGSGVFGLEKVWQLEPSNYVNSESKNDLCAYKPPFPDDPCIPFSCTPGRDEVTQPDDRETPENVTSMELLDATNKQTCSQDNNCRTSSLFISNQRQCTNLSDRNTNQMLASDGVKCLIKESTSCWSDTRHKMSTMLKLSYKTAQSESDISGHEMELSRVKAEEGKVGSRKEVVKEKTEDARMGERKGRVNEEQEYSSEFAVFAKNNISNGAPEGTQEQIEKTSNLSFNCHLKIPPTSTVYEQYQLCVDQLHHLRVSQSQHIGCLIESPAKERMTSEEIAAAVEAPALPTSGFEFNSTTNPEIKKRLNKVGSKRVTAAERDVINKNQDRSKYNRNRATLPEHGQTKHCVESRSVCQRNTVTSDTHLDLDFNKCGEFIKGTAGGITSTYKVINTPMEHLRKAPGENVPTVEESAALTTNPGLLPKRIRHNPGAKGCRSGVKGQKKKVSLRLCEKSSVSLSSPTNKEILQRPQSSGVIEHTKRHTPEDKVKPTLAYRVTAKCLPRTETHTPLHDDPRPTSPASSACQCEQTDCKHSPAGVPVFDCWLCLPDEVWLSILSLLPHSDLCRVVQVCSRLHTLATDHTLWKNLRIENSNLTERWLLCVGRRHPRSLCLYSCSGVSLTSWWLEVFFTLCRNFLEEVKVTSCTGPGLHGDQMLPLIGQLCHHVISVDVSWSGATDTGVKALSDCCASLCRLEVFGCQFLTPSCLQRVYEMCPGLQHLNIGQVPKVNARSLTVMTSQLKCLISLNLTGLQAVTDASVDTLLQNCVELQRLTFSSCPGVTDLTLHSISKYTPCIRSLDVSGCKAVTDAGVQSLALGCIRLQQLDLSSTGTGNRGVSLLANYCSRHLHTVKLSFCHITLENILKLCRHCKRLKMLHLYGCAHLPTEREIREANTTVKVYPLS
ncbi:uncharacterized protein LOC122876706 isoform X2 [Siniperca chuatsi]|uniref:uncharacterized protein LOC122876706 isoform X2 n=1 Tax=Siniperca chuatsi TaxID=119488 RepID=UPI001CE0CE7D|nr:uncharacterized protein LOC122876706 isoform X2 [Siniperca chuatsi]